MSWLSGATPASGAECLYDLLKTLLSSSLGTGRVVRTSGTGASGTGSGVYAQLGDAITAALQTPAATAIALLTNPRAWFVVRGRGFYDGSTLVVREFCFQTDGANGLRVKYSPRVGFVDTSTPASASVVPKASDEQLLLGGGIDASPTFAALFPSTATRMVGYASEYDDRFWFLSYPIGGGPASALLMLDLPQTVPLAGSTLLDKDPALLYALAGSNAALLAGLAGETTAPLSVFAYADTTIPSRQLWGRCAAEVLCARDSGGTLRVVYPGGGSTSMLYPSATTFPDAPVRYARRAALAGTTLSGESGNNATTDDKGYSSTLRWSGAPTATIPALLDTVDPATGLVSKGGRLAIGDVLLAWSGDPLLL